MQTEKLGIGISIRGIDANVATAAEMSTIKDLLYKNRLIVLKDQAVSEQQYCNFANRFGFPVPYLQENYRHPDFPLIFVSSNVKSKGQQIGVPRTGGYWHSDTSFEREPKVITMLMPKVLPPTTPAAPGSSTWRPSMPSCPGHQGEAGRRRAAAQRPLSLQDPPRQRRLRHLRDPAGDRRLRAPVRHPAVIEHPYTKERVLYANSGFTIGIADRSLDKSAAILREVFALLNPTGSCGRFARRWATSSSGTTGS